MRIAILGPYFWPQLYGIEKVMYAHAKGLAARGHDVYVVTSRLRYPDGADDELPAKEVRENFEIRRIKVLVRAAPGYVSYPSRGGVWLQGLQTTLDALRPDILHAHNSGAAAWAFGASLYAQRNGAAMFYSPHFHTNKIRFGTLRKSLLYALNYLPLRKASRIYHLTSLDFPKFSAEYRYARVDRFAVLPNGVERPELSGNQRNAASHVLNMLFVGRVDDVRKGFAVLEKAIDGLHHDVRSQLRLSVVGSVLDSTRKRLSEKYRDFIRIFGAVSEAELEKAYQEADLFIMPSLYEGFGMPYIEAMRYGTPVIGTTAGGVPEVVPDGTGLLVDPGDVEGAVQAITLLVSDREARTRMGLAAAEWSKRFHWDSIVDGLEADYHSTSQHSVRDR